MSILEDIVKAIGSSVSGAFRNGQGAGVNNVSKASRVAFGGDVALAIPAAGTNNNERRSSDPILVKGVKGGASFVRYTLRGGAQYFAQLILGG